MGNKLEYTIREASEEYERRHGLKPHQVKTTAHPFDVSGYSRCPDAKSKAEWLSKELGIRVVVV